MLTLLLQLNPSSQKVGPWETGIDVDRPNVMPSSHRGTLLLYIHQVYHTKLFHNTGNWNVLLGIPIEEVDTPTKHQYHKVELIMDQIYPIDY